MKIFLSIIFISCFAFGARNEVLTYSDIIAKLYDLPALAKLPKKGEKCALFSSYDRASKYDEKTDSYIQWEANCDWKGFVKQEGEALVLAEMNGPGVVWRMWSATVAEGNVRIYLDGNLAIDLPWKDYFSGNVPPFNRKGLVYNAAQGWNNYTPIPFQKSCKIVTKITKNQQENLKVAQGTYGKFFQFTYSLFPKNTKVQTFNMKLSAEENAALDKANEILTTKLGKNPVKYKNTKPEKVIWNIQPGKSKTLKITGKRAITTLKIQIPKHENYNDLLRQLTLSITWDNQNSPSVWSPIGDFFGTAPGINEYKSLVMGMMENKAQNSNKFEFYSYWYMPFEKNAKISIKNESDKTQKIILFVEHAPIKSSFDNLGYFHAKWHRDLSPNKKRPIDWTVLKTKGRGRFVGMMLHIWNARGGWWGEGDEKFFVDGEKFPSTFGTGSEDYFGYAWCNPKIFSAPFHSQTTNKINRGQISVNRWHITDNIPFQKSFEADIEKYFQNSRKTLYAAVAYWYLDKSGIDPIKKTPLKDRIGYCTGLEIYNEKSAFECEKFSKIKFSNGKTNTQNLAMFGNKWSNDEQLFWTDANPKDFIEFEIYNDENIEKNLFAQFTKANDYAIIQLYFNGKKVGKKIDLYSPIIDVTGKLKLGKVKFKKGKNILKIKIIGANPKAVKSYFVGVDFFKFE